MGRARPMASMMQAMVLAVPITIQVPTDGARRPLIQFSLGNVDDAARYLPPKAAAVGAGRRGLQPCDGPPTMGPVGTTTAGRSTLAAAMTWAGRGLVTSTDQSPPASRGWKTNHFLGVHGHFRLAQEHGGGVAETFRRVEMVGEKHHGQSGPQQNARALRFRSRSGTCRAGIVVAEGVGHTRRSGRSSASRITGQL